MAAAQAVRSRQRLLLRYLRACGLASATAFIAVACSNGGGGGGTPVKPAAALAAPPASGDGDKGSGHAGGDRGHHSDNGVFNADEGAQIATDTPRGRPRRDAHRSADAGSGGGAGGDQTSEDQDFPIGGAAPAAPEAPTGGSDTFDDNANATNAPSVKLHSTGYGYSGLSDAQIFGGAAGTGRVTSPYSGALSFSTGGVYDIYKAISVGVRGYQGEGAFESNSRFAKTIRSTKLIYDNGWVEFAMITSDGQRVSLAGPMQGRAAALHDADGRGSSANGYVQCLDANGECSTALIKVDDGAGHKVYVISRNMNVYVYRSLATDPNKASNYALKQFASMALRPFTGNNSELSTIRLHTSEIIGGESTVLIEVSKGLTGNTSQSQPEVLGLAGPLVKQANGPIAGSPLNLQQGLAERQGEVNLEPSTIAASITDARLVRNNGRGAIEIAVQFGGTETLNLIIGGRQSAIDASVRL